ncbi:MAG: efflux RND transporter periplasmic adaptor subunit [Syntrophomonadaceae bacterium]|nr:efflux RND transporter periplasmic adaptor subunit [Syntrophomonadaceae bacterium]
MLKIPNRKRMLIIALVAAALIIAYLWMRAERVTGLQVESEDYTPSLLLSGEVVAETPITLSSLISGTVVQSPVKAGDQVKAGQLILQLDDRQAVIAREAAAMAVETARANLRLASTLSKENAGAASIEADLAAEKARMQYERMQTLYSNGAISQQELETAQQSQAISAENARAARLLLESYQNGGVNLEILQSQLKQRQSDLEAKELNVLQHRITAPADGIVLENSAREGEMVLAGTSLAVIAAGQQVRIRIQPDQRYSQLVSANNRALVWIPYEAAKKWEARVVYTEPAGNAEQGSIKAELALLKEVPELYPGRLVSVQLFGALQQDVIIIDNAYLTVDRGQEGVWVARNGRAHFVPVQTGLRSPEGIIIREGLHEGDLILEPQGLREGQRVTVRTNRND